MDVRRVRPPDYLAGLAGLVLLFSLFTPWYTVSDGTATGWSSLRLIDLWLALTAALAIALPIVTLAREAPALPVAVDVLTALASFVGVLLVLYRLLALPNAEFTTGRSWGVLLAAVAVLGTAAGAYWAVRKQDMPATRPPPEVRAMPTPPERDPLAPPTETG